MATSFEQISKLIFMEMQDNNFSKMDTDLALDWLSDLIITSATVDFNVCEKDLSNYKPYKEHSISLDISQESTSITVNRSEDNDMNNVILRVNDSEICNDEYSYEFTTDNVIITYPFNKDDKVTVIQYFLGEFEEDLNSREKYIIALGAGNHYIQHKILKEENIKAHFGDKDYSMTSSWQTLKVLLTMKSQLDDKLEKYLIQYARDNVDVEDLM